MKKSTVLRLLCTAFSVLLVLPVFAGCSGSTGSDPENGTSAQLTSAAATTGVYDTLKTDIALSGTKFNILMTGQGGRTPDDFSYENNMTVMDDAIYRRNMIMEENYGVIISGTHDFGTSNTGNAQMSKAYISGSCDYDMCVLAAYDASSLAINGYLYDLCKLPHVNLQNTWWDQCAQRDLSIAGSLFFTNGAASTVVDDFTHCVIFNKKLYAEKVTDGTDVYALAASGEWTLDELTRLSSLVSNDLNGDHNMDSNDLYGLMIWDNDLVAQMNASGSLIASVDADGMLKLDTYSERAASVIEKFVNLGNSDCCINFQHMTGGVTWMNMFTNGQVLFFMTMFNEVSRFRDMKTDYGILPIPKLDSEQGWYSPISPWHASFICVSAVCADPEITGAVIELLGYHSERIIKPAYYEKTLVGTYIRDDESKTMLDIIFDNRIYDVGHLYRIANLQELLTNLLRNNRPDGLSGVYSSVSSSAQVIIDNYNKSIEDLKKSY